jgi:hypothetical protein
VFVGKNKRKSSYKKRGEFVMFKDEVIGKIELLIQLYKEGKLGGGYGVEVNLREEYDEKK